MCHILNLDAFSWGETPKGVSFKKVRLTVMLAMQCHRSPYFFTIHIHPCQSLAPRVQWSTAASDYVLF